MRGGIQGRGDGRREGDGRGREMLWMRGMVEERDRCNDNVNNQEVIWTYSQSMTTLGFSIVALILSAFTYGWFHLC